MITGAAAVADYCPLYGVKGFRIDKDEVIDEYKKFTDIIHSHNSFIFVQLAHSGLHSTGDIIYSPSVNKGFTQDKNSKEMTKEDIIRIEEDFAKAAIRAKKSGFDGIQILGAQTSLISNFLSPKYNRRTDEYGGSDENRARFLIEIIKKIKNVVGNDMAISLKIESEDKNGIITESGFTKACLMAEEAGIDLIEVSGIDTPKNIGPYYYKPAKKIAEKLKIPVALIGGIKTFEEAEFILNDSKIEYIGLVTPLIREPDLIKKWENKNIN